MAGSTKSSLPFGRFLPAVFWLTLYSLVVFFFRGAFGIPFFADDYSFLQLADPARVQSLSDVLAFFAPGKEHFYRPLSTELFYYLIQLTPWPATVGHGAVFGVYAAGLVLMFSVARRLFSMVASSRKLLSDAGALLFAGIMTCLYAVSFTHVFQLYWLATFQEVLMFTTLLASLLFFLRERYAWALIWYIAALLSKETALMYPVVLAALVVLVPGLRQGGQFRQRLLHTGFMVLCAVVAYTLYESGIQTNAETQTEYQLQFSPSLAVNNLVWYSLWSLGVPQNLSDYMTSLFAAPLPRFWEFMKNPAFRWYLYLLGAYWITFIIACGYLGVRSLTLIKKLNKQVNKTWQSVIHSAITPLCIAGTIFTVFLAPFLFIVHRWMVRLTMPLIGVILVQAIVFLLLWSWSRSGTLGRVLFVALAVLFGAWNYLGIQVHEEISTYRLEAALVVQLEQYFTEHEEEIRAADVLVFEEPSQTQGLSSWFGSEKIKGTLSDQAFLQYYIPGAELSVKYGVDVQQGTIHTVPTEAIIEAALKR